MCYQFNKHNIYKLKFDSDTFTWTRTLNFFNFFISLKIIFRGQNKYSPIDLCILVHKCEEQSPIGLLIINSKRQVRSFVGASCMLEKGKYTVVCTAFSHWGSGKVYFIYPSIDKYIYHQ